MKFLESKGFSIAEIMIALGALSVVGLGFNRLMDTQVKGEHELKSRFAVNELYRGVRTRFTDKDACNHTFAGNPTLTIGGTLAVTDIKDRNNNVLLATGGTYTDGLIDVPAIRLDNISVTATSTPRIADANLVIEFRRISDILDSNAIVQKKIPLQFEVNGSNQIQNCYSNESVALDTTIEEVCSLWQGVYNISTGECVLAAYTDSSSATGTDPYMMLSTDHLAQKNAPGTGEVDLRYVALSGDSMTGNLIIEGDGTTSGNLMGTTKVCIGSTSGKCRTLGATIAGAADNYPRRIQEDGEFALWNPEKNVWSETCGATQLITGFSPGTGTKICNNPYCTVSNNSTTIAVSFCNGNAATHSNPPYIPTPTPTPTPTPSCSGYSYGGYCWYSAHATSCTSFCSSRGGCNLSGTRDFVGSGGTIANCSIVAAGVGFSSVGGDYDTYNVNYNEGCVYDYNMDYNDTPWGAKAKRRYGLTTTCTSSVSSGYYRVCACNN